MSKLTKAEQKWINDVQRVLDKCPFKRMGFFTTGCSDVTIYDSSLQDDAYRILDSGNTSDFSLAVEKVGAVLGSLTFPEQVESTAG